MTCAQANSYFAQAGAKALAALPEGVREHLGACPHCRSVWEFFAGGDTPTEVSPEVQSQIEDTVLGSLEPVSPLPSARVLASMFLLIFGGLSAIVIGLTGLRHGAVGMGALQFAGALGIVGAAAVLTALTLSRGMVPGEKTWVLPARLTVLTLLALFAVVGILFPWSWTQDFFPAGWRCFRHGLMFSLPAGLLFVGILRRGAVLSLGAVGAAAGLLAGLVGVVVLHFACGMHTAPHIAIAHLGVPLAATVTGFLMGRFLPPLLPGARAAQYRQ